MPLKKTKFHVDEKIPSKEEIIWALKNVREGNYKANKIISSLTSHPKWQDNVLHRCPLCGYETTVTNIHRNCPEAPIDPNIDEKLPLDMRHMSVPMYVVEDAP